MLSLSKHEAAMNYDYDLFVIGGGSASPAAVGRAGEVPVAALAMRRAEGANDKI